MYEQHWRLLQKLKATENAITLWVVSDEDVDN